MCILESSSSKVNKALQFKSTVQACWYCRIKGEENILSEIKQNKIFTNNYIYNTCSNDSELLLPKV